MNVCQEIWWHQVQSDMATLAILRRAGADPCQQLHYLQMATEKLGKAYFCKPGLPPPRSHAALVPFLRSMGGIPQSRRDGIAALFAFKPYLSFQAWINAALPVAYELERLAPALAQDGPNPESPWPQGTPIHCPANFRFPIWEQVTKTAKGRQFIQTIQTLVDQFPGYA